MASLRVAVIASWYPSPQKPLLGAFALHQAQALSRHYRVALVAPLRIWWRDAGRLRPGALPVEQEGPVATFRRRWLSPFPRCPQRWVHRRAVQAIRREFQRLLREWGRPDLLHAHVVLPAGYAAVELGSEHGIPTVLTEHSSPFAMHLQSAGEREMVRRGLRGASRVLAVGPGLREEIRAFESELRVDVVGNLIDTDYFTPGNENIGQRPVRFFTACGFAAQKGLSHLLRAAGRLTAHAETGFELVIAGDGSLRGALEREAAELGLGPRCRFLGWLGQEQVREQLRACDVFVVSSLHETFCMAAAEAMACGKPLLTTRCGGPEYLVSPATGMVVEPGDVDALAEAMAVFVRGEHRFRPEAIRSSIVERFGAAAFLQKLSRIYCEVLGRSDVEICAEPARRRSETTC
jgi:glycosyltransferase involved in cell wall biosynthesis